MVVKYSTGLNNVGLAKYIIGPNKAYSSAYDIDANKLKLLKGKSFIKLPNKNSIIFNKRKFSSYPNNNFKTLKQNIKLSKIKFSLQNQKFFTSYSSLRNKINEQKLKLKEEKAKSKKLKWWAGLSVSSLFVLVFMKYKYSVINDSLNQYDDEIIDVKPTSWKLFCYQALPLNAISRIWGNFNRIELPVWAREPGFKFYSYVFGANLNEIKEKNLKKYRNLSEFFYRELEDGARPIDFESDIICPSDGKVLSVGLINEFGQIEQVKGMSYSVSKFLGISKKQEYWTNNGVKEVTSDVSEENQHKEFAQINGISYSVDDLLGLNNDKDVHHYLKHTNYKYEGDRSLENSGPVKDLETSDVLKTAAETAVTSTKHQLANSTKKLFYSVIYLAPGDYHRFHSPANWVVQVRRYFTGELYSVAPYFQRILANLFILNERVSLLGYWKHGFFSMTPVGATNVGSIKINFDKELVTNKKYDATGELLKKNTCYEANYFKNSSILRGLPLKKSAEIGGFELGSTIVLVFEAPESFKFNVEDGQTVKMGQSLGTVS